MICMSFTLGALCIRERNSSRIDLERPLRVKLGDPGKSVTSPHFRREWTFALFLECPHSAKPGRRAAGPA
jgi:hypothetical protein